MAVAYKARSGQPIKDGFCSFLTAAQVTFAIRMNDDITPDSYITDLNNYLSDEMRNRFYYTTGEADPVDPG